MAPSFSTIDSRGISRGILLTDGTNNDATGDNTVNSNSTISNDNDDDDDNARYCIVNDDDDSGADDDDGDDDDYDNDDNDDNDDIFHYNKQNIIDINENMVLFFVKP